MLIKSKNLAKNICNKGFRDLTMDPPNLALISLDISTEAASEIKTNTYEAFSTHLPVVREVYNFIK